MGDRRGLRVLFVSLTILSVICLSDGHVRFVCPRPQSPRSDIYYQLPMNLLNGPCGLGDSPTDGSDIMEVTPGPFTVRFEETVIHKESSFEISLHDDNGTSCTLLNHIPHNDQAKVINPNCKVNDYPLGHCLQSTYYLTVNIPDITCRQCYLKLTFTTVDSTKDLPCLQPNGTCKTYVSCANIKIKSTTPNRNGLESCRAYSSNLLGRWPYTQKEKFQAELNTSRVIVDFTYDYYDQSLTFLIPTERIGHITSVGIYQIGDNTNPLMRKSISVEDNSPEGGLVTGLWQQISKDYLTHLTIKLFYVKVVTSEKTYTGRISFVNEEYQLGVYYPHSDSYSSQGWLNGPQFVGPQATYSPGVHPAGQCAPEPYYYIATLNPKSENMTSNTSHPPHGVLTMAFIDNRVHITGMFHGLPNQKQTVQINRPILAGADSFSVPLSSTSWGKFIDTTLDASSQMPYIESTKFFKSVVVMTRGQPDMMCGLLEQGIVAVLTGPAGLYGNAVFQFRKDTSLSYSILVNGKEKRIVGVTLNGPARVGEVGQVIYDLTSYFSEHFLDNTWFANGTFQDLTSEMLLHLWQGHLYINVRLENDSMESRIISGQISKPGSWYCSHRQIFCPHFHLYLNGREPDYGTKIIPTRAEAVFIVDRGNALQYSIQVQVSSPHELVLSAAITERGDKHLTFRKFRTTEPDAGLLHVPVFEVHGKLPQISPVLEQLLRNGKLELAVSTSQYPSGKIVGQIPKLQRPPCITQQKRFHVEWNVLDYQSIDLNTVVGDMVLFTYGGNDTVYRLLNRIMYSACDFTNSTLIGQLMSSQQPKGTIQHTLEHAGEFYFASEINCNHSLKIAITVAGKGAVPSGDCLVSVYQQWYSSRLVGRGGTGVVGAIIGASILAVATMIVVVLLDRRRRFQAESTTGFQRF